MQTLKHGGKRSNSGRKPVSDKKITLSIYPHKSRIDFLGIDIAKERALMAIEKEYERKLKVS